MPDIILYIGGGIAIVVMLGGGATFGRWLFKKGKTTGLELANDAVAEAQAALAAVSAATEVLAESDTVKPAVKPKAAADKA